MKARATDKAALALAGLSLLAATACGRATSDSGIPAASGRSTSVAASATADNAARTAAITAELSLPTASLRSGASTQGRITVHNASGHDITFVGCGRAYAVPLVSSVHRADISWPLCAMQMSIPRGTSTYPVTIRASYSECSPSPTRGMPGCRTDGTMPGLPPGRYEAMPAAVSPVIPVPAPVPFRVSG